MTLDPTDDLAAPIDGPGFRLVLVPPAVLLAATEGVGAVAWPGVGSIDEELVAAMPAALRIRQAEADPSVAAWLVRGILVEDRGAATGLRVVGHLGGHDRPDADGVVEVGYTLATGERGRGLATAATATWFAWAHRHGARTARLSIVPGNAPSIAIAARLGFRPSDAVWDEDDAVWEQVFLAPLPLDHAP